MLSVTKTIDTRMGFRRERTESKLKSLPKSLTPFAKKFYKNNSLAVFLVHFLFENGLKVRVKSGLKIFRNHSARFGSFFIA